MKRRTALSHLVGVKLGGTAIRGPVVALDASAFATVEGAVAPAAKWVQVGYEGEFRGHVNGPFQLTRELFEQAITNFRALPQYRVGSSTAVADLINAGTFDCIPWDFHHASEQDPTSGSIPTDGAPAQGWVLELELRTGADGKAQLWSYTRFLEPLRSYVAQGKYKWCSMTLHLSATDPVSGKAIGPYISSVAATNDPFLQGMVPLAASRRSALGQTIQASYWLDPYDMPCTPEDAIEVIRDMLKLPETSAAAEIAAELGKLQAWAAAPETAPAGVEVAELIGCLRKIVNLPLTASVDDVFGAVFTVLALPNGTQADGAAGAPANVTAQRAGSPSLFELSLDEAAVVERLSERDIQQIVAGKEWKALCVLGLSDASALRVMNYLAGRAPAARLGGAPPSGNPDTVARKDPMDTKLLSRIAKLLGVASDAADVEQQIVVKLEAGTSATKNLEAILAALEVENPQGATAKIAEMFKKCAQLEEVMPELGELRKKKEEAEEMKAEADVDKAMEAHRLPASLRKSLILHRKSDPAEFAATYPVAPADKTYLTQRQFAGGDNNGAGASHRLSGPGKGPAGAPPPPPGDGRGEVIDLSRYAGRNPTERALAYLAETQGETFKSLSYDAKFAMARKVIAQTRPGAAGARP